MSDSDNNFNKKLEIDTKDKYTILEILNSDCWRHIFSYVSTKDLIRSERVSKEWRELVIDYFRTSSKRTLRTSSYPKLTLRMLVQILMQRGAAFTRLSIKRSLIMSSYNSIFVIGDFCPNLKHLKIVANNIKTCVCLRVFLSCPNLKTIHLISINFNGAEKFYNTTFINNYLSLEKLILEGDKTNGKFLAVNITKFKNIKFLAFFECCNLNKTYLESLKQLPYLTTLKMDSCSFSVLQIILQILGNLTQLQELSLRDYESHNKFDHIVMEQQFCEAISKLPLLKHLNIGANTLVSKDIVMKQIAQTCELLESLDVSCSSVGDEGVIAVCGSCENLKALNVTCLQRLSIHGVKAMSRVVRLECLTAHGLQMPDVMASFAACLMGCPTLKKLDACGSNITSELINTAVAALERHPRPLELYLAGTDVTITDEIARHSLLFVRNCCNTYKWRRR